jgi:hypothetical protein
MSGPGPPLRRRSHRGFFARARQAPRRHRSHTKRPGWGAWRTPTKRRGFCPGPVLGCRRRSVALRENSKRPTHALTLSRTVDGESSRAAMNPRAAWRPATWEAITGHHRRGSCGRACRTVTSPASCSSAPHRRLPPAQRVQQARCDVAGRAHRDGPARAADFGLMPRGRARVVQLAWTVNGTGMTCPLPSRNCAHSW